MSVRFQATIYQYGAHARLDIPADISRVFNEKGYVAVHGTMNGKGVRATLMPITGGRHVMYINRQMTARANVHVGDTVECVLDRDMENRKPVPTELAEALDADAVAKRAWETASPSYRKRTIAFLSWFSTPTTREKKVEKILRDLKRSNVGS